jgi:hypothetical protein
MKRFEKIPLWLQCLMFVVGFLLLLSLESIIENLISFLLCV